VLAITRWYDNDRRIEQKIQSQKDIVYMWNYVHRLLLSMPFEVELSYHHYEAHYVTTSDDEANVMSGSMLECRGHKLKVRSDGLLSW
jgi:hypothetical protein